MCGLKSQFLTTRWPKTFFVPGIVFFWVNNPREVKEFVSTTVVLSLVLPVRSLTLYVFWNTLVQMGGVGNLVQVGVKWHICRFFLFLKFRNKFLVKMMLFEKLLKFSVIFSNSYWSFRLLWYRFTLGTKVSKFCALATPVIIFEIFKGHFRLLWYRFTLGTKVSEFCALATPMIIFEIFKGHFRLFWYLLS